MPAVLEPRTEFTPDQRPRKRWTRFEVQEFLKLGIPGLERYELFDGELIEKVSKNSKHFRCAVRSRNHLSGVFGLEYLWIEDPLRLCSPEGIFTEPEPDLAVLAHPAADYAEPPEPGDVRLLIEIADSTLDFDLGQKADRYAASSLADYWVLDVKGRRVIVHRDPVDGKYTSVLSYAADELVAPLAAPDAGVLVRELFAPEEAGE